MLQMFAQHLHHHSQVTGVSEASGEMPVVAEVSKARNTTPTSPCPCDRNERRHSQGVGEASEASDDTCVI